MRYSHSPVTRAVARLNPGPRIEVGVIHRVAGVPVILAATDDASLVRAILERVIAKQERDTRGHPVEAAAQTAQMQVLQRLLAGLPEER